LLRRADLVIVPGWKGKAVPVRRLAAAAATSPRTLLRRSVETIGMAPGDCSRHRRSASTASPRWRATVRPQRCAITSGGVFT
jgi:hypothetical protein